MAKTKFLDYTGLAKLVEKIKNTYVTMMGGNEFNFIGKSGWNESSSIAFNYRKPDGSYVGTPITNYTFYNGQGKATGVGVYAESFNGKINGHTVEKNVPSNAVFTDTNTTYTFTSGTGGTFTVKASNSDSGQTVSVGVPAKASAATSAETAATAEKVGSETVGSATQPIYLSGGKPTKCTYTLAQNVTSASKLTDHLYNAGEGLKLTTGTTADTFSLSAATSSTIGGVKIGNNISITSGTISLTKGNVINALGYTPPTADTNTHYTTGLIVGNSSSSTGNTAVTTNGVFLNLKDDNNIRNSHKIVGGGGTTVTSDSGGTITIDTIYTLSRNVNNHAEISLTSVNGSDDITINNVENAETAERLSTLTAGGEIQPVYFDGGIPKPLKYTIGKSVPSNAVFTDKNVYQVSDNSTTTVLPLLLSPLSEDTKADEAHQTTNAKYNFSIGAVPSEGKIKATIFDGTTFTGNAATATKASQDGDGNTISSAYLKLIGGTMSGTITTVKDSKPAIDFRGPHGSCGATLNYDTAGNEALAVNLQQATTSFMVNSGTNGKTWTSSGKYSTVTPTLQVKGKYVSINKFIPDNTTPTHTLEVNGSIKATSFDGTASRATYADKYSYNGMDRDFVYDAVDGGNHYIRCKDATIIRANGTNLNKYDFVINSDGKGGCYIYDAANAKGTTLSPDGIFFEKAPANSLVAANGTFATAISDTDIKNEINSAIDWTQAL